MNPKTKTNLKCCAFAVRAAVVVALSTSALLPALEARRAVLTLVALACALLGLVSALLHRLFMKRLKPEQRTDGGQQQVDLQKMADT